MLKRKISEVLRAWQLTKTKQGLLVTGARQVGKTSSIERFAADFYDNIVKIDFVELPSAVEPYRFRFKFGRSYCAHYGIGEKATSRWQNPLVF